MFDQKKDKAKILIVDDSAESIHLLSEELMSDYEVYAATDGQQALERIVTNPPDLVLLDVLMPGMSGHEVCRKLKADRATSEIPIIFITAKDDEEDEAKGLALGAVDYITKPFRLKVVRARVDTILKLKNEMDLRQKLADDLTKLNTELEKEVEEQVAKLRMADDEIRSSEELLRVVLANILDLVFMTDDDGNFTFICSNCSNIIGYTMDDLMTMEKVSSLISDSLEYTKDLHDKDAVHNIEQVIEDKSGKERVFLISVKSVSIRESTQLWTCREITRRKKLEDRLRQAYKMEAIGTLAGGIAHDFNNILSAIMGFTEISKESLQDESPLKGYLARVLEAGSRAKELVNHILMFSRETEQELKPLTISPPVKEALRLIRASVPTTIDIHQNILTDAVVMGDPTQIHQLVMNLCTNASHAMRENGGAMNISLVDQEISSKELVQYPELSPGVYVKMSVSDTGHGIPAELIDRIFDPFFTTKDKSEGTGMGLSVVHGIIKNHGGVIRVDSEAGKGTTFEMLIPAMKYIPVEAVVEGDIVVEGGNETILFIDDEEMIVDIGKAMLENLGYRVVTKTSAMEALALFKEDPGRFDLIISDMTMPKMTGMKLAQEVLGIRPGMPIIICTGFSDEITEELAADNGIAGLIFKPILKGDLSSKVHKVLNR